VVKEASVKGVQDVGARVEGKLSIEQGCSDTKALEEQLDTVSLCVGRKEG